MKVLEYLNSGKSLSDLTTDYGIKSRMYPCGTCILNYDQIDHGTLGKKDHPIVKECRSLVLGYQNDKWFEISRAFDRFFNMGECGLKFDTTKGKLLAASKEDGSIVSLYHNPLHDKWFFRSRSGAFGEHETSYGGSFEKNILETIGLSREEFDIKSQYLNPNYTIICEWVSPKNRIVTPYSKSELVILGVRLNDTGDDVDQVFEEEFNDSFIKLIFQNVRLPEYHSFDTVEEMLEAVGNLTGLKEGFVVYQKETGLRLKVKSTVYEQAHHLRGNPGEAVSVGTIH